MLVVLKDELGLKTSLELQILQSLFSRQECLVFEKLSLKHNVSMIEIALDRHKYSSEQIYKAIALACGAKYESSLPTDFIPIISGKDWKNALKTNIIPVINGQKQLFFLHALEGEFLIKFVLEAENDPTFGEKFLLIPPAHFRFLIRKNAREAWTQGAISTLTKHAPRFSSHTGFEKPTLVLGIVAILGLMIGSFFISTLVAQILSIVFSLIFLSLVIMRLGFSLTPHDQPIAFIKGDDPLPLYSIIIPLYDEVDMVQPLLNNLEALDYPKLKLDIKIVIEADDPATFKALRACETTLVLDIIIAPPLGPRTKPKALMLALPFVKGEFVVVYDAEDCPHPLQLREAVSRFSSSPSKMAVLQAPLTLRNASKNFLTRYFAADYASLFDVILPSFAKLNLPLPLGGTSNHFKTAVLRRIGGWDPYNVTEDADIGFRLARLGYKADVLRFETSEIAPETFMVWLKQRSRWFKGWLQTLYVHFKRPRDLVYDLGAFKAAMIMLLLGGSFLSALLHPFGVMALLFYGSPFGLFFLILGYFLGAVALYMGAKRQNRLKLRFILLALPLWWMLLSLAAWHALKELYLRPFHWAKTPHLKS